MGNGFIGIKTGTTPGAGNCVSLNYVDQKKEIDVSGITSDPVMAAIFQDTAATTLREQIAAERGQPIAGGDAASLAVSNSDPATLFGEAANNWATLAFGGENE